MKDRNIKKQKYGGWWGFAFGGLAFALAECVGKNLINNFFKKKNRQNAFEEKLKQDRYESQQQAEAQRKAEKEDAELRLKQKDKEVKRFVFEKLGLDIVETPQGERVYPTDPTTERKRLPLVGSLVARGDICLLVSNPGVGKSAMAFQMADEIAEGRESKLFHTPEGHQLPQQVFYWDAELDVDDMTERYPNGLSQNLRRFSNLYYRNGFYLLKHIIEELLLMTSDTTLFLDNWRALCSNSDANIFLAALRRLQAMFVERESRLTIVIVVHTTKEAKDEPDLEDVAGTADLTRFTKTVLILNPTEDDRIVRLHDAKRRTKKNRDSFFMVKGGVGTTENLRFESLFNVMEEEKAQQLMDDLDDSSNLPKKPGRRKKISADNAKSIAERLDNDERVEDLAVEFGVCETTIRSSAKPFRRH